MNRRSFLKTGLVGAGLLLLGGSSLALIPTRSIATPTRALKVFDADGFQILVALANRVVKDSDRDAVAIAHGVDDLMTRLPSEVQADTRKLLGLFESALAGLLFDGRLLPFTRLSPESQDAVLRHWRDSRVTLRRVGYQALKKLCFVSHYSQPSSWGPVGFPPPANVSGPYAESKMGTPEWLKEHDLEAVP
jgi:TAT (twin-arginine translocation) pathway signal sequence